MEMSLDENHYGPRSYCVPLLAADGHIRPLSEIEAEVIRVALIHHRGNVVAVARALQISRSTLYRRLSELGIAVEQHQTSLTIV